MSGDGNRTVLCDRTRARPRLYRPHVELN